MNSEHADVDVDITCRPASRAFPLIQAMHLSRRCVLALVPMLIADHE
jgi:hypothetical protein